MTRRILVLGGTTEARRLAGMLVGRRDLDVTVSLAGRTALPLPYPVPTRVGGFGGVTGLAGYLKRERVSAMVDATHPYAAVISGSAVLAAEAASIPLLALRRPPWTRGAGDLWEEVKDAEGAVTSLGVAPRRVFLALGRQEILPFEAAPQHHYLIRSVDPVSPPLRLPEANYRLGRGPFDWNEERALLLEHRTEVVVAKNSGGVATYGKIVAARELGVRVIVLQRPSMPPVPEATEPRAVVAWLDHVLALRGV